ncbi:hypothetical protein [Streptomyces spiramyceticus]|uniref:hypothetical protein n=1 Tax=Streptomyces spiramyceticus TaxID=299717 RepID=UPI00237B06FA|nr:hypothetical protein [Streptomyces spiramyceticus]
MTDTISQFAARLAQVERQLARTSRTAQLAYSSIEGGAINVHDDDGGIRGVIGQQPDGTTGVVIVNGAPPPMPTAPVVEPALAGLKITWDGEFADAMAAPLDLARVQVHLLASADVSPDVRKPAATIEAGSGASVTIARQSYDGLWVRLVALNTSGIPGAASDAVAAAPRKTQGGDLAAGSVGLDKVAGALADSTLQRFTDTLGDPASWTVTGKGPGAEWTHVSGVSDAATGGTVGRASGFVRIRGNTPLPYDPTALYRVSARIRAMAQPTTGPDSVYVGVLGIASDGIRLVNRNGEDSPISHCYPAASYAPLPVADGWTTYVGYVQGRAALGENGDAGTNPDLRTPGRLHADVRYVVPYLWLNYTSQAAASLAVMEVDAVQIEAVRTGAVGPDNLVAGSVTADALAADAITGKVITGGSLHSYNEQGSTVDIQNGTVKATAASGYAILVDPTQQLPVLDFLNSAGATAGSVNAMGNDNRPGLVVSSGPFSDGEVSDWRWANRMGADGAANRWVALRVRESDTTVSKGGYLALEPARVVTGIVDTEAAGPPTLFQIDPGLFFLDEGRVLIEPPASAFTALLVAARTTHTGALARFAVGGEDRFAVSAAGHVSAAGGVAAAGPVTGMNVPVPIYKPTNTDRASSVALVADPHLTVQLQANARYLVEFHLHYAALSAAAFKTAWVVPTGATGNRSVLGPGSTATEANADNLSMRSGVHAPTTTVVYGTRNHATNLAHAVESGIITTTTAGTLALSWAQNVSNATAARLAIGSYMQVTRLA